MWAIGLACLAGVIWLWENIQSDDQIGKLIIVAVLGLAWSGIVFVVAGIIAAILGAVGIMGGKQ